MLLGARGFFIDFIAHLLTVVLFWVENGVIFYQFGGLLRQFAFSCVIRLGQFGFSLA